MARRTFQIELDGPFFTKDPRKTFRQNVRVLMERMASIGTAEVQHRIGAIPPAGVKTGRTRRLVRGRVASLTGKKWAVTAVISVDTSGLGRAEAISAKAAGSAIEARAHPFKRAATSLRKAGREVDLTRGLN